MSKKERIGDGAGPRGPSGSQRATRTSQLVALVVLSGDPAEARERLAALAPGAGVVELAKADLSPRRAAATARAMRAAGFDAAALFCLSARWQRRRAPLLAVAAAGGARRVLLFSADGDAEWFPAARVALRELPRTAAEVLLAPLVSAIDWLLSTAVLALWRFRPPAQRPVTKDGPLRWLYLRQTPASGALESGASTHFRGLLEGMDELGEEVHVLANDRLPTIRPSGRRHVTVTPPDVWFNSSIFASERWANLVWLGRAWREIGRVRPDAVYHRNARSAWASVVACWLRGVPVVLEYNVPETVAGAHWNNLRSLGGVRRAERVSLAGATRVSAVSRELAALAVAAGARAERVFENPNGVDVGRFGTPEAEAAGRELRARLGVGDRVVAGFVGTFLPFHGVDALCEAAERCAGDERVVFVFVGDGGQRPATERRLAPLMRDGRVLFTGRVGFETLPAYLAAFDVCLAPYVAVPPGSPFINSPIKLFEYMAARRAIVASRLGQIGRLIADGESGLLIPEGDGAALAEAVGRLAGDPALRARLGAAAREAAAARYTWKANAARAASAVRDEE